MRRKTHLATLRKKRSAEKARKQRGRERKQSVGDTSPKKGGWTFSKKVPKPTKFYRG